MKKLILVLTIFLWSNTSHTQTDPTLAVGLETLTYGKGTIDLELLTEIIMEKQKELKQEALKRFMFNLFPEGNYTTKFYLQNALHILMNEQNPEVIKKELLEILTNYSLALGFTSAYKEIHPEYLEQVSATLSTSKDFSDNYLNEFDDYLKSKKRSYLLFGSNIATLKTKYKDKKEELYALVKSDEIIKFLILSYKVEGFIIKNPTYSEGWLFQEIQNKINISNYQNNPQLYTDLIGLVNEKKVFDLYGFYLELRTLKSKENFDDHKNWLQKTYNKITSYQLNELIKTNTIVNNSHIIDSISLESNRKTIQDIHLAEILKSKNESAIYSSELENALENNDLNTVLSIIKYSPISNTNEDLNLYKDNASIIEDYLYIDDSINKLISAEDISYPKEKLYGLFEIFEDDLNEEKKLIKQITTLKNKISDKSIRKGINNSDLSQINNTKKTIPFGLLLDVISTSLSQNDTLRNKGFFKQRINYTNGKTFTNLTPKTQKEIKFLEQHISKTINDYVTNYNTIKEIASNLKDLDGDNVFEELKKLYFERFTEEFFNDGLKEIIDLYGDNIDDVLLKESQNFIERLKTLDQTIENLSIKEDNLHKDLKKLDSLIKNKNNGRKWKNEADAFIKRIDTVSNFEEETIKLVNSLNEKVKSVNENQNDIQLKLFDDTEFTLNSTAPEYESKTRLNYLKELKAWIEKDHSNISNSKAELDSLKKNIKKLKAQIAKQLPRDKILDLLLKNLSAKLNNETIHLNDSITTKKIASFTKSLYLTIEKLKKNETISIKDVYNLQKDVLPNLIELKILSPDNAEILKNWSSDIKKIISFLNIEAVDQIVDQKLTKEKILKIKDLLKFISNLDNLDKAETFEHVINLFREGNEEVNKHLKDGDFKNLYNLFSNAVKKYTLVNSKEQYIEVDVASFLVELEGYYDKNDNSKFGFYLGIGLSQNFFLDKVRLAEGEDPARSIGFASEKLGVKYKIMDFQRSSDYTNLVPNDIYLSKRSPFVNEWYVNLYGSGLLYSIANTTTNQNFDFAHVGFGSGIRFYNALDFSLNIGFPLGQKSKPLKDAFVGFGFDIPLSEYLTRSKSKRAKKSKTAN